MKEAKLSAKIKMDPIVKKTLEINGNHVTLTEIFLAMFL